MHKKSQEPIAISLQEQTKSEKKTYENRFEYFREFRGNDETN